MVYQELIYILPNNLEDELQENLAALNFHNFFIEKKPKSPNLLKVYLQNEHSVEILDYLNTYSLEKLQDQEVKEIDWLKSWMETLQPFQLVPDVWVNPFPDRSIDKSPKQLVLNIIPGTAFGTGLHATTQLAAQAMEHIDIKGKDVLDVGCGTGILGMLAYYRQANSVTCIDEDPLAIQKCKEIFKQNKLKNEKIQTYASNLLDEVSNEKKYDFIIANIIFEILDLLLKDQKLQSILKPNTQFIFSGVSETKLELMQNLFQEEGIEVLEHFKQKNWNSFLFKY